MQLIKKFVFCLAPVLAFGLAIGLAAPAAASDAVPDVAGATMLDADGVIDLIQSDPQLVIVDTRLKDVYNTGYIDGAIQFLDTDITDAEALMPLLGSMDRSVLFYCKSVKCGRAINAAKLAVEYGYTNVHYYPYGIDDWSAQGLPIASN